jgi:hypothetical protein
MKHAALALSILALAGSAAEAQDVGAAAARTPEIVRLQLRNQDVVQGYLKGHSKDEIVIYTSDARFRHVNLADVQRFEVRARTGNHAKRGALIGVAVWVGAVAAASRGSLDKWGVASWQSGAVLGGSVALGALIGSQVPRYGWSATQPSAIMGSGISPGVHVSLRF